MRLRRLTATRYRGLEQLVLDSGPCTVLIGPSNTGKPTVLEAVDRCWRWTPSCYWAGRPRQV